MADTSKRKTYDDIDNEQKPKKKNKPLAEFIPASFFKGRLPSAIALTFYDIEKKHPFMCSLNLKSASFSPMIIYSIMQHHQITELKYDNICLYGFMFIEPGVSHPSVICNEKICCEAISECEKQKLIPYDKHNEDVKEKPGNIKSTEPDIKKEEIPEGSPSRSLDEYDKIIKKNDNFTVKIIKENETKEQEIIISGSFILCYFLKKIINKMNDLNTPIKAEPYTITGHKEADYFSLMLNNMITDLMCSK